MIDKIYAMSSFLQFREVYGSEVKFSDYLGFPRKKEITQMEKQSIESANALLAYFEKQVPLWAADGKTAILLSGGMDSAIVARYMPEGSMAYTLKCIVTGRKVIDETATAAEYCKTSNLNHKIVEVYWEDYERFSPALMKRKNAPIHSIEVQLYKAALQAKTDGFERVLVGDSADMVFGGLDGFLKKDYTFGEFVDRFAYVLPYKVLKKAMFISEPYAKWTRNGFVDGYGYMNDVFSSESTNSYVNACEAADMTVIDAYLPLTHNIKADITQIRNGLSKPIVRDAFRLAYGKNAPEKIPLPRPMSEWLENWQGPKRPEFWENCHVNMTGDQKYYVWILERFLDEMGI
jgi:7-cyano-7-deazaguanine synthase in queuosine biosynthesis